MRSLVRAAALAAVCALLGAPASAKPPLTVFLARHAEREASGSDPSLNDGGKKRADTLAGLLADAGITAIFTSEFKRTQETAAPLAKRLGIAVTVVPGKDVEGLLAKLRALGPGGRALVVGHSNTVPEIARKLTGAPVPDMTDAQFDRLLIAGTDEAGAGTVSILHYGEPTP